MKKFKIVSLITFVLILATAILPLKFYLFEKSKLKKIKEENNTYDKAIFKVLLKNIQKEAAKNKCKNYILSISEVEGKIAEDYPNLKTDLNIVLSKYDKWKIRANSKIRKEMDKRIEEKFAVWGSMGIGNEMEYIAGKQLNTDMRTRYSAKAECRDISNIEKGKIKIILSIFDDVSGTNVFKTSTTFLKNSIVGKLERNKMQSKTSLFILLFIVVLYFVYVLVFLVVAYIKRKKKKFYQDQDYYSLEIEKREELIRNGHFVLTLELCDKYLEFFPENTEIKAFRQRILDFSNNEPKKAQLAWVENRKLQMKLNSNSFLSKEEQEKIKELLPYSRELLNSYEHYEKMSLKLLENKNNENEKILNSAKEMVKIGRIEEAKEKLISLENYDRVKEFLKTIIPIKSDKLTLKKENSNSETTIFFKNCIIIGREDEDYSSDIQIEDKRVSRNHLKIEFVEKEVFAKDLNSTGGTFLDGEKISKVKIKNGQTLTISRIIDCSISIFDKAFMLKIKDKTYMLIPHKAKISYDDNGFSLKNGESNLIFKNSHVIYFDDKDTHFLNPGIKFKMGENNCSII